ncbi:glucose-1-phosphatase/inositol phosphatase [Yersinia aldovae]|nr:glucose-1-phosphatase/inositol phosphatase [Yersinia aldovae]
MIKINTAYTLTVLALLLPTSTSVLAQDKSDNYQLEQVLVMSRHGVSIPALVPRTF